MSEEVVVETAPAPEKKRLRWIDQARGFTMFFLVFTLVFPEVWTTNWDDPTGNFITYALHFLFDHAPTRGTYMTLFDIGAAAFIFILGFMMSVTYRRRVEKEGKKAANLHIFWRYLVLSLIGFLIIMIDLELVELKDGLLIVSWDVVPSIATAGWVTFILIQVKNPKIRMGIGYAMALIYQILMILTPLKEYALLSVHGGIFGSLYSYSAISIIASSLGDYIFDMSIDEKEKYRNFLIFGAINLVVGLGISFIPGWEANKRQVSFTHDLISIGITIIALWFFSWLDRRKDKNLGYFIAYGMNPFFVYFIVELPNLLVDMLVGTDLGMESEWLGRVILTIIYIAYTSIIMWYLYKKKKVISTTKAGIIFLSVAVLLFILIILLFPEML